MSVESDGMKGVDETAFFERIIAGPGFADNPLLPQLQRLLEIYRRLEQRTNRLAGEHEQLKTELVNLVRSLELVGRIDAMTGLANRRDIMDRIEREASRCQRHQRIFSILLINLDDFGAVNDAHGFNFGDDVLVEVARVLRGGMRSEDLCSRWGGDEFLILLPETGLEGARAVAEKLLEAVGMTEFRAPRPGIRLTASIGIKEFLPPQSAYECVSAAGRALQQAKREGKNRFAEAQ